LKRENEIVFPDDSQIDMIVALCMQQSQTTGSSRPAGKGSSYRKYGGGGGGGRNFSGKKGKRKASSTHRGRAGSSDGRAVSNGGRKGAGLVRPLTGKNRC
jgi:hypothetical protein